ncbi:galactosyltransferase-related protein [Kitasatospora sp. NPDC089509]|uniref:galactosyltransferase-related protein n=1 Tax=Kitasatospora sp. NPDC089509 TaxID=3364079 RepID=UPI003830E7D0
MDPVDAHSVLTPENASARADAAAGSGAGAADALVVLWDPGSQVSRPLWDHTEPLVRAVRDAVAGLSERPGGEALRACLTELRRTPTSLTARLHFAEAVDCWTGPDSEALEVARTVAAYRRDGAVFPVTGQRYEHVGPQSERPMASAAPPARRGTVDGHWDLTVVVDFRAAPGHTGRLDNVLATLRSLADQSLDAERYRVVVVEQDTVPRHRERVLPWADAYLHQFAEGPYNRSRAHNAGAAAAPGKGNRLCFLDADMLLDRGFLRQALAAVETAGTAAALPYDRVVYLDALSSARAIAQRAAGAARAARATLHGYHLTPTTGGCVIVEQALFDRLGGYDEGFEGWGDEDNEFYHRLDRAAGVRRLPGELLHLDHERPVMRKPSPDIAPVPRTTPTEGGSA